MKTNSSKPITICGTQFIDRPDQSISRSTEESIDYTPENLIAFGFKNLTITQNGTTKPLSRDDDKFIAYGPTLEEARATFWAPWSIFIKKAFKTNYLVIHPN